MELQPKRKMLRTFADKQTIHHSYFFASSLSALFHIFLSLFTFFAFVFFFRRRRSVRFFHLFQCSALSQFFISFARIHPVFRSPFQIESLCRFLICCDNFAHTVSLAQRCAPSIDTILFFDRIWIQYSIS